MTRLISFLALWVLTFSVTAREVITVEGDTIRGNEEQPKVTHIVPWQDDSLTLSLEKRSYSQVKNQLLKPISRRQILREQDKILETLLGESNLSQE